MPNTFASCARESGDAGPFSLAALYRAWQGCRRRKRGTRSAQRYELRLLDNLVETRDALQARRWSPGRSVCFVTLRPKAREVHAAGFADRVVHHLLVPPLEALFEPVFIHDSYSNRQGKGTHAAVDRLQGFMRQASRNGRRRAWYLQLDIRNFFVSLDRGILLGLLHRRLAKALRQDRIERERAGALYWLCRQLLETPLAGQVIRRGPAADFDRVPAYKRLETAPVGKGIPIGNLTSQFFANVYLDRLDQFVKHELGHRWYLRYVDDFVLVDTDRERLLEARRRIEAFLRETLALELKDAGVLRPVSAGSDFLGYLVRPGYRLVRRRVVIHLRERLDEYRRRLYRCEGAGVTLVLHKADREALRATLASYLGHFEHASTHRLCGSLWRRYPWLGRLLRLAPTGRLIPLWEAMEAVYFEEQCAWFIRQWPGFAVLVQRGREFVLRGGAALGTSDGAALPLSGLESFRRRLRKDGLPHVFAAEEGLPGGGLKRRVLRLAWAKDL